jgi:hypothetical protein
MDQKTANALATGAGGTVTLGGEPYAVAQPTEEDTKVIGLFLKKQLARLNGKGHEPDADTMLDLLCSLEGVRFLAYTLLRKARPDLPWKLVCDEIQEHNYIHWYAELDAASGMADLGNSAGRPGSSTPTS